MFPTGPHETMRDIGHIMADIGPQVGSTECYSQSFALGLKGARVSATSMARNLEPRDLRGEQQDPEDDGLVAPNPNQHDSA